MKRLGYVMLCAACSKGSATGGIDAAPSVDAKATDAAPGVYSHRIMIDGIDDFLSAEQFPTTSSGYDARVTWDADNVYVGYSGADLHPSAAESGTKWLFVYLDADPAGGASTSETYNTQGATFPTGMRPDWYLRWKCDETLLSMKTWNGTAWVEDGTALLAARVGSFVEIAIPRATLGASAQKVQLVTWMINEKANVESSYAGLFGGHFVDGYAANLALAKYLKIDFAAAREPNDAANVGP